MSAYFLEMKLPQRVQPLLEITSMGEIDFMKLGEGEA